MWIHDRGVDRLRTVLKDKRRRVLARDEIEFIKFPIFSSQFHDFIDSVQIELLLLRLDRIPWDFNINAGKIFIFLQSFIDQGKIFILNSTSFAFRPFRAPATQ
jgi:hypothetical protein